MTLIGWYRQLLLNPYDPNRVIDGTNRVIDGTLGEFHRQLLLKSP